MEDEPIEQNPEIRLQLIPAPDESPLRSPEFQEELQTFTQALKAQGINASSTWFTQDAVGGGGWSVGEFTLLLTTLGPVIVKLRKLIEAFLKVREGRKLKLKCGPVTIEGHAEDVEKLVTSDQIAKMLKGPKKSRKKNQL